MEWQQLLDYARGGTHPGYEKAQKILDEYLKNMQVENCLINEKLAANVFRLPGCIIAGTDFDELPGLGTSYWHGQNTTSTVAYRQNTGMQLHCRYPDREKRFAFDGEWARYVLRLREGEYACYSLYDVTVLSKLEVACYAEEPAVLEITQDGKPLGTFDLSGTEHRQILSSMHLFNADSCVLRLKALRGTVDIEALMTDTDT